MRNGLTESSNRLEQFDDKVDQIKITAYGHYVYNTLVFNFAYIDLVCLDSGVFDEELSNYLSRSANDESKLKQSNNILDRMDIRLERADKYIEYLQKQEEEEIILFNLDFNEIRFSEKVRQSFNEEKIKVLNSAKRNQ